jgi:hypothetical protein
LEGESRKDQASFAAKFPTEMLLWGKLAALTDSFTETSHKKTLSAVYQLGSEKRYAKFCLLVHPAMQQG